MTKKNISNSDKDTKIAKKRRPVRQILVALFLLIILLVWLGPYLFSTGKGSALMVSVLNNYTEEKIEVASVSLSWLGPCRASGVKVWDPTGRDIFQLEKAQWTKGIWHAIFSRENFDQINLDQPRAVVYMPEEGKVTPSETRKVTPQKKEPSNKGSFPALTGRLIVRAGGVRMVRPDGRSYDIKQINGEFDVRTLNQIKGTIQLSLPEGSQLKGQVNVNQLITGNQLSLEKATGTMQFATDGPVALGPLMEFIQTKTTAGGKAQVNVEAVFESGQVRADISTNITGLHVSWEDAVNVQPMDINFDGHVEISNEKINGNGKLVSQAGNINTSFNYIPGKETVDISSDDIVEAILTGKEIKLPDFSFEANGDVDLAILAAAVPAMLKVRPDMQITTGRLNIDKLSMRSGDETVATGAIGLVNLSALRNGKKITSEPVSVDFDLYLERQVGLQIKQFQLNSVFAQMSATGTATKIKGQFKADLDKLNQQIHDYLELPAFELAGNMEGSVDVNRSDKEQASIDLKIIGKAIHYRINGRVLDVQDIELQLQIGRPDSKVGYISTGKATIGNFTLDGQPLAGYDIVLSWDRTRFSPEEEIITIKQTQIDSQLLSAKLSGTIKEYKSTCLLDLNLWYKGSWEKISALLHEVAPETADTIALTGTSENTFAITGPLRQQQPQPGFRGLNAKGGVNWTSGVAYGLQMGQTEISPTLKEGIIRLGDATIPVGDGKVFLKNILVSLQAEEPMLIISGKAPILQAVPINPQVGRQLLSYINPIFNEMASMDGDISLVLEDVALPLSKNIKHSGVGRGNLDLSRMNIKASGLLAELMRLGGIVDTDASGQISKVSSIDFFIKDQRIHYDNFVVFLTKDFDVKFYGSVGFDDTVDLVVSIPIRQGILEKLGVRGWVSEYARLLAGARVDIPVVGTRQKAKLDFAKVDIEPLIKSVSSVLVTGQLTTVIEDILKPKPKKEEGPRKTSPDKSPKEDAVDILLDVLRKNNQPKGSKDNK